MGRDFHSRAGAVVQRKVLKVTWTKDPANAPFPGIYAAVDFSGTFATMDRYCGYMAWYQASLSEPFQLMRIEENMMDNAVVEKAAREGKRAEADAAWTAAAQYCPNYQP